MKSVIVYEDKDILIAHKPSGLASQTAKVGQADMVSELKNYLAVKQPGQAPYLGVVHRLDQPVEGLLVFAKNKEAAAALTKQLTSGALHKRYYAVICGQPKQTSGELVDYLYKNGNGKAQIVTEKEAARQNAKKAVLKYRMIQTVKLPEKELVLMDIFIETGRFHQIRAQMAHAGMPLLGDCKYGAEEAKRLSANLGIRNVALCAGKIKLRHPATGEEMEFQTVPEGKVFSYFEDSYPEVK